MLITIRKATLSTLLFGLLLVSPGTGRSAPDERAAPRFPYDPVCAWGRIANGQGILVRCLTQAEAEALLRPAPPTPVNTHEASATSTAVTPAPAATPASAQSGPPAAPPAPALAPQVAPAPGAPPPPAGPPVAEVPPNKGHVSVTDILPAVADAGTLPEAHKNLRAARAKLAACVRDNGGLSGPTGEVNVRFLVRERGIAEGVSVSKRAGVTPKAAQCIADVVDRRRVGVPDAPMVGASMTIRFGESAQ